MTLARQLLFGIAIAFIALLIGIEVIYVTAARSSLEEQLDAHANETATSLAMSMGARTRVLDASFAHIMINPVFDRGHFASIKVLSANGKLIFGRRLKHFESDVPRWFIALVRLRGPVGQALITSGWKQLGRVIVQIHPGYAYEQLYNTALATLIWLGLLFALALVAVRYYLAGILKPLQEIERTAQAISERNFTSIALEPRTRELRRVTAAMNSLSAKIRDAIAHETARAERLHKEAFEDPSTGKLNRRGFEQSVAAVLDTGGEIHSGALALFRVSGIEEVNRVFGLSRGDAILKLLADLLAAPGAQGTALVGRWQGPTLAAFVANTSSQPALAWADALCKGFSERLREQGMAEGIVLCCGLGHFSEVTASNARLAEVAERALSRAQKQGGAVLESLQRGAPSPGLDLRAEIESAINANRIALLGQKVISIPGQEVLQIELLSSLLGTEGQAIPAASFVPIASQYGLLPSLDARMIEQAFDALECLASLPREVSVNVSMQSIGDERFRSALRTLLARNKQLAPRLVVEITGYAASRSPELTREFAAELRQLGSRVALDNFEFDRNSMTIVHELLPSYIKLAPAFTREIAAREDLRFIVEAMVRMLRPLEIPLIAQGVEDPAAAAILAELGLAAYQGYAGGRPEPLH